ncbi:Ubiquitin-conjugating enzyme E2 T [Apophysomyces ossiformis]|uniref:E2 ubiquitin-conjugating enzyme n=1 Tax=Apophysomyces ossiformis TaxID=679940 RepID=A0A8H7EQE2_9FUNG|nr:Ubiquitin-conjugating enzyme E2 T [Apophysomyces ossiformis]
MASNVRLNRLNKELADLEKDPPPGIVCYPVEDDITQLESYIKGPPDSPYEKGLFQLEINIPEQYPFHPPQIRFKTRIYHPNIDENGRICASILKQDGWKPSLNLSTTLISLSTLMACPNPDDPLDADIAKEYTLDHAAFVKKATEYTLRYAVERQNDASENNSTKDDVAADTKNDAEEEQNEEKTTTTTTSTTESKSRLTLSKKKQKSKAYVDQVEQSNNVGDKRPRETPASDEKASTAVAEANEEKQTLVKPSSDAITQSIEATSSKPMKKAKISLSKSKRKTSD